MSPLVTVLNTAIALVWAADAIADALACIVVAKLRAFCSVAAAVDATPIFLMDSVYKSTLIFANAIPVDTNL